MSGAYRCVHVPIKAAASGNLVALVPFLIPPALILIAYKLYGPMIFIVPAVCIAGIVVLVKAIKAERKVKSVPKSKPKAEQVERVQILRDPYRTFSAGEPGLCLNCKTREYTHVLGVKGYQIPVCDPCLEYATKRIEQGHIRGIR